MSRRTNLLCDGSHSRSSRQTVQHPGRLSALPLLMHAILQVPGPLTHPSHYVRAALPEYMGPTLGVSRSLSWTSNPPCPHILRYRRRRGMEQCSLSLSLSYNLALRPTRSLPIVFVFSSPSTLIVVHSLSVVHQEITTGLGAAIGSPQRETLVQPCQAGILGVG